MAPNHPVGTCNRIFFRYLHTWFGLFGTKGVGLSAQHWKVGSLYPTTLKDLAHGPTGGCLTSVSARGGTVSVECGRDSASI